MKFPALNKLNAHFGFARAIPTDAAESRIIPFAISSEKRDRYNTVLLLENWELANYRKNPVVGFNHPFFAWSENHQFNPDLTIGIGSISKDNDNKLLIGAVSFEPEEINPLAEKIFKKVLHGTYKSTSVGFYESKGGAYGEGEEAADGKTPTYYYGKQELLEFSIVEIPANTDATVRAILGDIRDKCPTFIANELDKIQEHTRKGAKAETEAFLEFMEMELDILALS